MILVPLNDRGTGKGLLRSCDAINRFLSINHNMMALKTSKWYQIARLVKACRLVCSMTIPRNLIGEWPDLGLGSYFKLTRYCHRILISHRLDDSNNKKKCINFMSLCFLVEKLEEVTILKTFYRWWPLVTLILTWPENVLCKSCRSFNYLPNAVCCLSLRCVVYEIWRGPKKPPSPRSEPFRARPEEG